MLLNIRVVWVAWVSTINMSTPPRMQSGWKLCSAKCLDISLQFPMILDFPHKNVRTEAWKANEKIVGWCIWHDVLRKQSPFLAEVVQFGWHKIPRNQLQVIVTSSLTK